MMAMMNTFVTTCSVIPATVLAAGLWLQADDWPIIKPLEESHVFRKTGMAAADRTFIALVRSETGVPIYKLECHSGEYEGDSEMNYSGDFQCALFALNGETLASGNLLAADTANELSTDWWNRGRMRSAQLTGECLKYPEYSTERHFRLRAMRLTLRFSDMEWGPKDHPHNPVLTGFTFTVTAAPDASARSPRAEVVSGARPPESCYP